MPSALHYGPNSVHITVTGAGGWGVNVADQQSSTHNLLHSVGIRSREILQAIEPELKRGDPYVDFATLVHSMATEAEYASMAFSSTEGSFDEVTQRLAATAAVLARDPRFNEVRFVRVEKRTVEDMLEGLRRITGRARQSYLREQNRVQTPEIPEQVSPAPFEFSVGHRLDVVEQPTHALLSADDIAAARQFLVDSAMRHLNSLTNSPQVYAELRVLIERLEANSNIVALGMAAEAFLRIVKASEEELGGARAGALRNFAEEVDRFASQFAEWQQYVENAARTRYGQDDIAQAVGALNELAKKLDRSTASIRAIDAIKEAAKFDSGTGKGKAGIVNTLKNFVVAVSKKVAEVVADRVLEGTVLTLAALAVSALSTPILQSLPWVAPLFEYLKSFLI